ncbi:MAG TPA: hypothetical protein VEA63_02180, partial [Opitutus sp.]|nr:hypothetical protein [Opitutus sp.]
MTSLNSGSLRPRIVRPQLSLLFFVSGAVALVYETVWQRQFALVFGSAAPATAAVLAAYFAGLGAGSVAIGRWARRCERPLRAYALLECGIAIGALTTPLWLAGAETLYPVIYDSAAMQPAVFVALRLVVAFAVMAMPTFCMGGTLPLLARWIDAGERRWGRTAGWLYVVNTAGAALGALCFPFVLFPRLGLAQTL